jgi:cell division protein FtsI/penicillin-binding protein 2
MTSYPEYDNNLITNAETKEEKKKVADDLVDKRRKFLNRAISGLFTPGSTVKPFFAYAALAENIISPEKNIYSSGQLVIKNKYGGPDTVFKDWKAHGYVDMRDAIAESSDEYFYQIESHARFVRKTCFSHLRGSSKFCLEWGRSSGPWVTPLWSVSEFYGIPHYQSTPFHLYGFSHCKVFCVIIYP